MQQFEYTNSLKNPEEPNFKNYTSSIHYTDTIIIKKSKRDRTKTIQQRIKAILKSSYKVEKPSSSNDSRDRFFNFRSKEKVGIGKYQQHAHKHDFVVACSCCLHIAVGQL